MFVKDVSSKASMGPKPLSSHHVTHPQLSLGHKPNMIPLRIHDDVFICLFETPTFLISTPHSQSSANLQHDIHQLQLSLNHDGRVRQYPSCGVTLVKDAIRIFGYMDWR